MKKQRAMNGVHDFEFGLGFKPTEVVENRLV
jgi:hypothetical protein